MFSQLLNEASFKLPERELEVVIRLVENYEFGIAFELLIDSLRDGGIAVSPKDMDGIQTLGKKMKFDDSKWQGIAVQPETTR